MSVKQQLKKLLRTTDVSEEMVEFARMFLLPFVQKMKSRASTIDDILQLFFNTETRKFYSGTVHTEFTMPGRFFKGSVRIAGIGPRKMNAGFHLLAVVDRVTQQAKVEVTNAKPLRMFELTRAEFESIQSRVHFIETK